MAYFNVLATADQPQRWMVVADGYQQGEPYDHQLGCGTATYGTYREALVAAEMMMTPDERDQVERENRMLARKLRRMR